MICMKKIFTTIALGFAAMIFLSVNGATAYADGIVLLGPSSQKLVPPQTVLDLNHQGNSTTESGGVGFNGSSDFRFGSGNFVSGPHNQTIAFSQTGATSAAGLRIIFNINEPNGQNRDSVTLNNLTLTAYNSQTGAATFIGSFAPAPQTLQQFTPAQGSTADYVFGLTPDAIARLQAALAADPNLRLGLFANISDAQGGPERFGFAGANNPSPAPVPEPATMILLGSGLAGVAAKMRKRRKVSEQ